MNIEQLCVYALKAFSKFTNFCQTVRAEDPLDFFTDPGLLKKNRIQIKVPKDSQT